MKCLSKMNMNMFHFLTKQNYSKYSQISMSMSFSSSEASTMFRSSTASSTSESVIFSKGLSIILSILMFYVTSSK